MTMTILARSVLLILLGLSACVPRYGTTAVVEGSSQSSQKFRSITIKEAVGTDASAAETAALFAQRLELRFADRQVPFGGDLTISYRVVSFDPGDRAARWVGFGLGIGSLVVEVTFSDRTGQQLSKVVTDGKVVGGFLGGDSELAVRNAAYEIVEYTVENYGLPNGPPPNPRGAVRHRAPIRVAN